MFDFLCSLSLMLAQNELEKKLTIFGIACFAGFMFYLILDSTIKQKFIPKAGPIRGFLIFLFLLAIVAFIVYINYLK